jgi:SAM-dependent methyltransferase
MTGQHRHGLAAVVDRPVVFADGCRMPFRDKAFDFVIAFHVLEHITRPELFLAELMRVARAGYIETPNVLFERLIPYDVHCLEVMNIGSRLFIHKKSAPATDTFSASLHIVPQSPKWNDFFFGNPEYFHVCHHWRDRIEFEIANPEEQCSWYMTGSEDTPPDPLASSAGARGAAIKALHKFYSFRRKSPVVLQNLLACPNCRVELLKTGSTFQCAQCGNTYPSDPWPLFTSPVAATS